MKLLNPSIPPNTIHADRLRAVVLDWSGTTVDFGSMAPARTMQFLFSGRGISLSDSETRQHMGLPKKEHIRSILSSPRVRNAWQHAHGAAPDDAVVDQMYAAFIPLQFSSLTEFSDVIPGVQDIVESFRRRSLKIGSTTGYTRAMLNVLLDSSAKAGYSPDCSLTPEEVGSGRPYPFMMYECAIRLKVFPLAAMVKIGDTPADVLEGLNAGAWSIGLAGTGNMIGLSQGEFNNLPESDRAFRLIQARDALEQAGAHYVIDTLAEVGAVLDDIDLRMGRQVG